MSENSQIGEQKIYTKESEISATKSVLSLLVAILKQFLINYCSVNAPIVLKDFSDTRYNVLYFNVLIDNLLMYKIGFKCQISPNLDVLWNYSPMTLTYTFFVAVKLFYCYKRSFNPMLVWITCSLIPAYGWPWNTLLSSYALFPCFGAVLSWPW